jgi:hypothetical protein
MWMAHLIAVAIYGACVLAIKKHAGGTFGKTECLADEAKAAAVEAALALDPNNAALQLRVAAWKRNGKAFLMLTLALPNKLFHIIASAGGLAKEVMRKLCAKYMPTDRISHVEAQCRYYDATCLDQYTHPCFLRQAFAQISAEFPLAAADDSRLMAIFFNIAPTMYQSVLATEQLIRPNCTADTLITAMEILFRQQHSVQEIRANGISAIETGLFQVGLCNGEDNDNSDNNNNKNDNDGDNNDNNNQNNDNNNQNYNNNNGNYNGSYNNNQYNRPSGNVFQLVISLEAATMVVGRSLGMSTWTEADTLMDLNSCCDKSTTIFKSSISLLLIRGGCYSVEFKVSLGWRE